MIYLITILRKNTQICPNFGSKIIVIEARVTKVTLSKISASFSKLTLFEITKLHFRKCISVFEEYEKEHGKYTAWQLIDSVDGFHPSQVKRQYTCKYIHA